MSNILDEIVAWKHKEVALGKLQCPTSFLEKQPGFQRVPVSLRSSLLDTDKYGIIAEFKRRSPSKGDIHQNADVLQITQGYASAGASALSVLTDQHFFGGKNADLEMARSGNTCPILRKDFTIDPYQVVEAKAIGADAILLIAACLEKKQLKSLAQLAKSLGLEVLLEVHDQQELDHWNEYVDVVGVNNRNLKTFEVNIQTSIELLEAMPAGVVRISESGINDPAVIVELRNRGFQGFLVGEYFMADAHPGEKCRAFIDRVRVLDELLKNAIA